MRFPLAAKASILVFAAAVGVLAIAILAVHEVFSEGQFSQWRRNAGGLVQFVTAQVIADPSPAGIDKLASRLNIDISYAGPAGSFRTRPDMPDAAAADPTGGHGFLRLRQHGHKGHGHRDHGPPPRRWQAFSVDGKYYLLHKQGPHRLIYSRAGSASNIFSDLPEVLAYSALALIALFAAVAIVLRRMLVPLKTVAANMRAIGTSGTSADIPRPKRMPDEVSSLIDSFNAMSARIKDLLAAKETLLRDVSHEVRSPLARLRLRIEAVEDPALRAQLSADLSTIDQLTSELLERARLEGGAKLDLAAVDAGVIMQQLRGNLPPEQQGFVELDLPEQAVSVLADQRLLSRALSNLLDNSIKYSRLSAGSIVLAVQPSADGKQAALSVGDAGSKIDDATLAKLTASFYRPDDSRARSTGGFGLGLAIADSVARAHGAELILSSPDAGGLLCKLCLPLANRS